MKPAHSYNFFCPHSAPLQLTTLGNLSESLMMLFSLISNNSKTIIGLFESSQIRQNV